MYHQELIRTQERQRSRADSYDQEANMTIFMEGTVAYMQGDWTFSGMSHSGIDSLTASLQQIESGGGSNVRLDCGQVSSVDINGLQLLEVWMQCAKFRGLEPELVNLSATMQKAIERNVPGCYSSTVTV